MEEFNNYSPDHDFETYRVGAYGGSKISNGLKTDLQNVSCPYNFTIINPDLYKRLTHFAFKQVNFLLRDSHLKKLSNILKDDEASDNDKFVALELLKNANIASNFILPSCQDTGTAIVLGKKGQSILTRPRITAEDPEYISDEEAISEGVYNAYTRENLRYSQLAPKSMFEETNTKCNLPAQIDLLTNSCHPHYYDFLFIAKGGGSANKAFLFQQNKSVLKPNKLSDFLLEQIRDLGTAACPPYHLSIVIGGLSAEMCLKTVKLGSCKFYDSLPTNGQEGVGIAFRNIEMEEELTSRCATELGIGAQFGGKYFVHDVRVIRLPRHGASVPIGIGVSCSADRQMVARIDGISRSVTVEKLCRDPSIYLPSLTDVERSRSCSPISVEKSIDLNLNELGSVGEALNLLTKYPIKTRVNITGTIIVARDIAHAKLLEILETTGSLPEYFRKYPVYYAGPAKTPEGRPSGSFGPTTANRMDSYVDVFQKAGGSKIMIGKGNRSNLVKEACQANQGFYLGSIGGAAAILAEKSIKKVEVLDMEELGMEAVWKINVENFPAFIIVDDKGNDFFDFKHHL